MLHSIAIHWPTAHLLGAAHSHSLGFDVTWSARAILALVAGILVLIRPKNINLIVAAYLIVLGVLEIVKFSW